MEKRLSSFVVFFFLLVILLTACVLRFYGLGSNPPGLYEDEAFFGSLAYCLLTTGRDFNGNFLPLISYGHLTSIPPLQIYPVVASVFVFGFNEFAVRFYPAFFSVLVVLLTFLLARFLFNDYVALFSSFFVAVSPWHVVYSRIGFANIVPTTLFFVFGLYLFLKGLKDGSRFMACGAFLIAMTFFSYYMSHMFVPFFLFGFHYLFYGELKASGKLRLYYLLLFMLAFSFVLSLTVTDIHKISGPFGMGGVSDVAPNFLEEVDVLLSLKGSWAWPSYPAGLGMLYPIYPPFLLLGFFLLVCDKNPKSLLLVYWLLLALVIGALTSDVFNGSLRRAMTFAGPVFEIIVAYSIYRVLSFYRKKSFFLLLVLLISFSLVLGVGRFLVHYSIYQPTSIEAEQLFMSPVKAVFNYTELVKDRYNRIIVTYDFPPTSHNSYKSLEDYRLFYTKSCITDSKYVFGNTSLYKPDDGNLYIVRGYELVNVTSNAVFYYSNGDVAYKVVS